MTFFLYSIAAETTELANPVIGTTLPAPAKLVSFEYRFKPVDNVDKNIKLKVV